MNSLKLKKIIAGMTAVLLVTSMTACGNSGEGGSETEEEFTTTTTTQATVPINTAELSDEDEEKIGSAIDMLQDVELENKTIKWFSFYDNFHASTAGNTKSLSLDLFERKYGGEIEYIPTSWSSFATDLATKVTGGEGIDFVPGEDLGDFPKGIVNGMYVSFDEYVDFDSDLWKDIKGINDMFELKGKHYVICTSSSANYVVYYNRQTIDSYGFDDPAELLEKGEWNWDTFKNMLVEYCDPDAGNYGLDNWFNEKPLMLTTGKGAVEIKDGKLVHNLMDADIERALNWQKSLWDNQCVLDKNLTGWSVHPEYIGEGKELFFIEGQHALTSAPDIWTKSYGEIGDVMFVPLPKDPEADKYYVPSKPAAYMLCKGAQNPQGVLLFAECDIASQRDEGAQEVQDDKFRNDYGWTDEMLEMRKKIDVMADENPVYDIIAGCPTDMSKILDSNEQGVRGPFYGLDWATQRDALVDTIDYMVEEFNAELDKME